MKTINVIATGVFYNCGRDEKRTYEYLKHIDTERPEFVLTRDDDDPRYGVIISAEENCEAMACIGRLDIGATISAMKQRGNDMITAQVQSVNYDGRYFTLGIEVEDDVEYSLHCDIDWSQWEPMDLPQMALSKDVRTIKRYINVLTPFVNGKKTLQTKSVVSYLKKLLEVSRFDMARETQEFLGNIRGALQQSDEMELRELSDDVYHAIQGFGSDRRIPEYLDKWAEVCESNEAFEMMSAWTILYEAGVDEKDKQELYQETINAIEADLMALPRNLWTEYTDIETFMHSLVYCYIPRKKLQSLISMLVMRAKLYDMIEEAPLPGFACPPPVRSAIGEGVDTPAKGVVNPVAENKEKKEYDCFIKLLAKCFYDDASVAKEFIDEIRPMKPRQVTMLVNQWVRAKKISDSSCHRELWKLLHENGYYKCSESNWNNQVG